MTDPADALLRTELPGIPVRRGKVRDVYDLGERLLIVATDRISAFDHVLPNGIPDKGRLLTQLSLFWFRKLAALGIEHHLIGDSLQGLDLPAGGTPRDRLEGRSMIVRKAVVFPIECVIRGYLAGSGWKDYQRTGAVCGHRLPPGLREADRLPQTLFTPATKADQGHDENITGEQAAERIGSEAAAELESRSHTIYEFAVEHARTRGIIIADTKFEFGRAADGRILVIDELLTPDSSRFWPADQYRPGTSPPSFDKQYVRDWLEATGWDKSSPPPALPPEVVARTREKYQEALERLTRP